MTTQYGFDGSFGKTAVEAVNANISTAMLKSLSNYLSTGTNSFVASYTGGKSLDGKGNGISIA